MVIFFSFFKINNYLVVLPYNSRNQLSCIKNIEKNMNKDYFIETDSKLIKEFLKASLSAINLQSKNVCRILKNEIIIGNGFLCNISDETLKKFYPVLITSINILKFYDINNDKEITLQFNNEECMSIIINDERKFFKSDKEGIGSLFIEIKKNDGLDIDNFLEIDDLLYKKNELEFDTKEKLIYLIHFLNKGVIPIKTFTIMNHISLYKYKIKDLKSVNECSIGCPIFNCSNLKIIGIYNLNNEINLNPRNYLISSINEYINDMNNSKNEIIIFLESDLKNCKKIYFLKNKKYRDKQTGEIFDDHYLKELSSFKIQLYIKFENEQEIKYNFKNYIISDRKGNYKIRLVFNNKITDCSHMFADCKLINKIDLSNFDMSNITCMNHMFSGCCNLKTIIFPKEPNTLKVNDMSYLFFKCTSLMELNLSSFNTENVVDMNHMFAKCDNLKLLNISSFSIKNTFNLNHMFYYCQTLENIDLSSFSSKNKVNDMSFMFHGCSRLKTIELKNFESKQNINIMNMFSYCYSLENIHISYISASNMKYLFYHCKNLKKMNLSCFNTKSINNMSHIFDNSSFNELDLSFFDTRNVIDMSYMFYGCKNLKWLKFSSLFDTSKVKNMSYMFSNCEIENLDLFYFNTKNVRDMNNMFSNFKLIGDNSKLDLSFFDTSRVTNMNSMFSECILTDLDLSSFNTKQVEEMNDMFYNSNILSFILDLTNFNLENVITMNNCFRCSLFHEINLSSLSAKKCKYMNNLFSNNKNLTKVNLTNFQTEDVLDMSHMFDKCTNLTTIDLSSLNIKNELNLSYMFNDCKNLRNIDFQFFNTKNATDMNHMFSNCINLQQIKGISFDFQNSTHLEYMFYNCIELNNIKTLSIKSQKLQSIQYMFYGFKNLEKIDFSSCDTKEVTEMNDIFYGCSKLTKLDLSMFNTKNVISMSNMFNQCIELKELNISSFDFHKVQTLRNMFYGCSHLIKLDIPLFEFNEKRIIINMLYGCHKLTSINLSFFNIIIENDICNKIFGCNHLIKLKEDENKIVKFKKD